MVLSEAFAKTICSRAEEKYHPFLAELMESGCCGHLCVESDVVLPPSICTTLSSTDSTFNTPVGQWGNRFYLQKNWKRETEVITGLKRLIRRKLPPLKVAADASLTDEQAAGVGLALNAPLMILSGGPGRGKTYTAGHIINACPSDFEIVVAAPTGKAAHHLGSAIEREVTCGTLHSLLALHRERPSPIRADLLIVDECSMIDARVFAALMGSISDSTRVVLMGDPDQLPPVDAGTLFAQMCQIPDIPHVHLTKCLRSDRRDILALADSINSGKLSLETTSGHLKFTKLSRDIDLHLERFSVGGYRILCGLKRGPHGSDAINRQLHAHFAAKEAQMEVPILITRSDPRLDLYNGETGTLIGEFAHFSDRDPIPSAILPAYEYAYATTVHKSQGSEFNHILLILSEGSEQFGRELLYTAVTRTRHTLEIVSSPEILSASVDRSSNKESGLIARFNSF